MSDPYNQDHDTTFDAIVNPYRDQPEPARHPGGRAMNQPPRTSRDQATLLLGCSGSLLLLSLAVAVVTLAWRW